MEENVTLVVDQNLQLLDLNVPLVFASGNTEVLEEIKLTLSVGPVIKCLL